MKIIPVAGTPTIPQPSSTGLATDKIARIKEVASGQPVTEPTPEEKEKLLAATQKTIVMNTNKTVNRTIEPPAEAVETPKAEPESTISDASVQTSEGSEATQPLSPQLAAIARQRRALQVKERELADKEKALGGQTRTELEARIKSQPLSVLQELGVTYDQLTQEILAQQGQINPEVEKLKAEIAELKGNVDKKFSDSQEAYESQAINYVADKLDALIGQGDDFDLLKAAEGEEEVIRRVYVHWKKTGKELDVAQVAKEYQEELANEAARYAKLKQVQGKLTPTEPLQPQAIPQQTGIRTLTNKDSARPAIARKQRAMLAFQGQLKR